TNRGEVRFAEIHRPRYNWRFSHGRGVGLTMRTASECYKGYEIEVVHTPPVWQANIYPESPQVPSLNRALPPIHCKTQEEAFAEARKRVDERG
ncbi:MAG: hypothetical protein ACREDV_07995, partial [Methylocella sp.]